MKLRSFWLRKIATRPIFHARFNELGLVRSFSLQNYALSTSACFHRAAQLLASPAIAVGPPFSATVEDMAFPVWQLNAA